jgi:ribosomal protein S18 acetylase RimI-like enzyme
LPYDRSGFLCGADALDRYVQTQLSQNMRRRLTTCFVALDTTNDQIAGFHTIASASVACTDMPPDSVRRLPRYPAFPAVRIGRLAVDQRYRGRGVGTGLMVDAARRAMRGPAAAFTLLVDAKDEQAAAFYRHHGFVALQQQPLTLFLPLAKAEKIVRSTSDK